MWGDQGVEGYEQVMKNVLAWGGETYILFQA